MNWVTLLTSEFDAWVGVGAGETDETGPVVVLGVLLGDGDGEGGEALGEGEMLGDGLGDGVPLGEGVALGLPEGEVLGDADALGQVGVGDGEGDLPRPVVPPTLARELDAPGAGVAGPPWLAPLMPVESLLGEMTWGSAVIAQDAATTTNRPVATAAAGRSQPHGPGLPGSGRSRAATAAAARASDAPT